MQHLGLPLAVKGITNGCGAKVTREKSLPESKMLGRKKVSEDAGMPCPRLPEEGGAGWSPLQLNSTQGWWLRKCSGLP